jgi:hypothetical protein
MYSSKYSFLFVHSPNLFSLSMHLISSYVVFCIIHLPFHSYKCVTFYAESVMSFAVPWCSLLRLAVTQCVSVTTYCVHNGKFLQMWGMNYVFGSSDLFRSPISEIVMYIILGISSKHTYYYQFSKEACRNFIRQPVGHRMMREYLATC